MAEKVLNKRKIIAFLLIIVVLLLSAAIYVMSNDKSSKPASSSMSEKDLKIAVEMLWDAKKNGDNKTIYSLADDSFQKMISESQFLKKNIKPVSSYEIEKIEINKENKSAVVRVKFKTVQVGFEFNPTLNERWVFNDSRGWAVNLSESVSPIGKM